MEEIILKELIKKRSLDTCNDFVIWADKSDLQPLAKKIAEAINYTRCCEELLCVKEDVDGLTAGKYYVELRKDKTHTKVVDDYGIETMYFSDRFVKPPKQ